MAVFTDKVIIITGASEGIGRALALELAPQKPKLVISARNVARLTELQKELEAKGAECLISVADVSLREDCQKIIAAAASFGRIDILINNAGVAMWALCQNITDVSIFERTMQTNYLGAAHCTYYALPHLIKTKGLIVATSSLSGLVGVPFLTAYSASKHAMFGFFNSLRVELRGTGVAITMAAPDFVASDIGLRTLGADGLPIGKNPKRKGPIMSAAQCAHALVKAMEKRKRLLLPNWRAKLAYPLSVIAPALTDAFASKVVKKKKRSLVT